MHGGHRVGVQGNVVMRVKTVYWLEYDSVALAVLVLGLGAVSLLAISI
jgi:hypothetical protein